MLTILENSICYRIIYTTIITLQLAYGHSVTGRLVKAITSMLGGWLTGSVMIRLFWVKDSLPLWQESITYRLISGATGLVKKLLEAISFIVYKGRETSLTFKLFSLYSHLLRTSPVKILFEIAFVFFAANLVIRLALRAYSPISLLFFAAGTAAAFLLRIYLEEIQTAFKESCFVRMATSSAVWVLSFSRQEAKK